MRAALVVLALVVVVAVKGKSVEPRAGDFLVTGLPGWDGPLPSRQYSGMLDIGVPPSGIGRMNMHWWLVESEGNPATDPLIVWYNGGPGASSIYGLMVELGPLWLNQLSLQGPIYNATGVPQLIRNPFTWATLGSLLIVDSPPPVGFSYCSQYGPTGNGTACGPWDDTSFAKANAQFFVNWFKLFPQYQSNDLYFTGESYAGVYLPVVVREILRTPGNKIVIKGIAMGDACLGTDVLCGPANSGASSPWWDVVFWFGHGQISNDMYTNIMSICGEAMLRSPNQSPACQAVIQDMYTALGGWYAYNYLDYCPGNVFRRRDRANPTYNWPGVGYPCPGSAMMQWINRTDVRKALNVPLNSSFFNGDNGVGFNYSTTERNVLPFFAEVLRGSKTRVLIYNGDADPSISSFRAQDAWFPFMKRAGFEVTQVWRPWTLDGQADVRGYVQEWNANQFAFATIRGSGHMVPEFRSEASLALMRSWISGQDFPKYNPS